ncbi:hypothetical protein [Candidatus Trichorickettsia mobilis]|uniref:hypothetical protein n=1 Tax=Candidatus Trichorickettsia mobilis TaxID=1346319 RepID=UPI0029313AC5|nr:hypothetical protein [Candidatus Trichorickettsia mobilis]
MDQDKTLERFVVYLKNIIFFKFIMYFLSIGILVWLLQIFEGDLIQSVEWLNKAHQSLYNATAKLASIMDSDDKILKAYHLYEDILTTSDKQRCDVRLKLVKNLRDLAAKYHLVDPVNIKMSQSFQRNVDQSIGDKIKVKNYDLQIQFAAPDFNVVLALISEAYTLLPEHSMTLFLEAQEQEVLTPSLIARLTSERYPDLINTVFNVRIREVTVKKR